ncbi:hypothetical protein PW52_15015 [Tamlana sedimentorum]|uniref:Transcription regulator BetR N-terminal domain-containing protein n=1 Tax=Neotamlana sedimentorum TaxID=1435349 RepID=A0A0D7W4S5_9FLAO|nr:hypothetical protein [Tamlana sedimentorum]KJD32787.1 hypothetical protein PW52_15015 [Tamlana sedimentorum]
MQEQFIKYLKNKSKNNTSFVDEMAGVLDIGYDAAYRRINLKTNLSLEESVKLAKHFKISLNKLFEIDSPDHIVVELPPLPKNEKGLEMWFKASLQNVLHLTKEKEAEFIYSGKDIPLFHLLTDSYLTRYKMYVWLKDLNEEMARTKISFDDWMKQIPVSLLNSAIELGELYKNINITELWSDNTVTGTLHQLIYYFEAGLVSKEVALKICDDIDLVIGHTEKMTINQSILETDRENSFKLYKCDLHVLTNSLMIVTPKQKVFYVPFTVLTYFKVEHEETCLLMHDFLRKQMSNSKLLVTAGEKDRTLFFNKIHSKIEITRQRIIREDAMTFL